MLGLIRGLLYAGAHSLLLTLWDVHDQSTAEFMTCFYRRFAGRGREGLRSTGRDDRIARTLSPPLPLGPLYANWQDFPRLALRQLFSIPPIFFDQVRTLMS